MKYVSKHGISQMLLSTVAGNTGTHLFKQILKDVERSAPLPTRHSHEGTTGGNHEVSRSSTRDTYLQGTFIFLS